jgi:hypothetical protein
MLRVSKKGFTRKGSVKVNYVLWPGGCMRIILGVGVGKTDRLCHKTNAGQFTKSGRSSIYCNSNNGTRMNLDKLLSFSHNSL